MFEFKTTALKKEKEIYESEADRKKAETWEQIQSRNDLTEAEKELLMLLLYASSCIRRANLESDYKKQYQALQDKGYIHELDDAHTFYETEPITFEEAEKRAIEHGWKKE